MKRNQQRKYLPILIIFFIIIGLLLAACGGGQKTYTIGVVNLTPGLDETVVGFKEGMTELGYIEGENVTYIYEGATESIDKLDSVAMKIWEQFRLYGFRAKINFRNLLKCLAVRNSRDTVSEAEFTEFLELADYMNFKYNPI